LKKNSLKAFKRLTKNEIKSLESYEYNF
jgi:hypothetical protein